MRDITINKGSEFKGLDVAYELVFPNRRAMLDGLSFNGNILQSIQPQAYCYSYMPELRLSDTMVQTMHNDINGTTNDTSCLGFEYICVPDGLEVYSGNMQEIYYSIYALVQSKTMLQYIGYICFYDEKGIELTISSDGPDEDYDPDSNAEAI